MWSKVDSQHGLYIAHYFLARSAPLRKFAFQATIYTYQFVIWFLNIYHGVRYVKISFYRKMTVVTSCKFEPDQLDTPFSTVHCLLKDEKTFFGMAPNKKFSQFGFLTMKKHSYSTALVLFVSRRWPPKKVPPSLFFGFSTVDPLKPL